MKLDGVFLPVTTPFDRVSGEVDLEGFASNVKAWCHHPIAGLVVGGSTGEAVLLDEAELLRLVERGATARRDGTALIAGTGAESTRATIRQCVGMAEAGADAVLVRAPAYFRARMTAEALRTHFLAVADASPVPLILYHVPKFVPVDVVPELAAELLRHGNIVGIKDSSGDLHNLGALCEAIGDAGAVVVGSGTVVYPGLEMGASGAIIAVGLLAPAAACELYRSWAAGRSAEAGRQQERIGPLHKRVVAGIGVAGVKHGLDLLGFVGGLSRPPLLPPTDRERLEVAEALEGAGLRDEASASTSG